MHPLEVYYRNQAGRELTTPGIGPVYYAPLYFKRGHGIGNFFCSLFRWVRPLLWSEAKAVGRENLRIGDKILTDIATRMYTADVSTGDIVSKHVSESAQNFISKLRGRACKRAWEAVGVMKKKVHKSKKIKHARKIIKRDIFLWFQFSHFSAADNVCRRPSVGSLTSLHTGLYRRLCTGQ